MQVSLCKYAIFSPILFELFLRASVSVSTNLVLEKSVSIGFEGFSGLVTRLLDIDSQTCFACSLGSLVFIIKL